MRVTGVRGVLEGERRGQGGIKVLVDLSVAFAVVFRLQCDSDRSLRKRGFWLYSLIYRKINQHSQNAYKLILANPQLCRVYSKPLLPWVDNQS